MRISFFKLLGAGAIALALSSAAWAQRSWQWPSERFNPQQQRNVAGQFDYYALVLSWSPTYCSESDGRDEQQCDRRDGRRFSFVLHGLWPQYENGYPQDCRTPRRPFVPQNTIDGMLNIMPSPRLVIHEYRKHGVCSGLDANGYFDLARRLFNSIKIPQRFENPMEAQFVSPREVFTDFVRANPGMTDDMMAISCGGAGNRLKEIRFCFGKDGKPRNCGNNEDQRRLCSANRMFVPPTRSTARDASPGADRYNSRPANPRYEQSPGTGGNSYPRSSPLPGPRMPQDGSARGI